MTTLRDCVLVSLSMAADALVVSLFLFSFYFFVTKCGSLSNPATHCNTTPSYHLHLLPSRQVVEQFFPTMRASGTWDLLQSMRMTADEAQDILNSGARATLVPPLGDSNCDASVPYLR